MAENAVVNTLCPIKLRICDTSAAISMPQISPPVEAISCPKVSLSMRFSTAAPHSMHLAIMALLSRKKIAPNTSAVLI